MGVAGHMLLIDDVVLSNGTTKGRMYVVFAVL